MKLKVLQNFLENKYIKKVLVSEKLAEVTSLCSDTSKSVRQLWHISINNPKDCIAVLCILPLLPDISRNKFWIERIRTHMAQTAFQYEYQGEWKIVQEILELSNFSLVPILETILHHKDTFYLFGNLTRNMNRLVGGFRARQYYLSVTEDKRPVTKPVWRRGYNDKGTLPDLQKLSLLHYYTPREAKLDLRPKISEPRKHEWLRKVRRK